MSFSGEDETPQWPGVSMLASPSRPGAPPVRLSPSASFHLEKMDVLWVAIELEAVQSVTVRSLPGLLAEWQVLSSSPLFTEQIVYAAVVIKAFEACYADILYTAVDAYVNELGEFYSYRDLLLGES